MTILLRQSVCSCSCAITLRNNYDQKRLGLNIFVEEKWRLKIALTADGNLIQRSPSKGLKPGSGQVTGEKQVGKTWRAPRFNFHVRRLCCGRM